MSNVSGDDLGLEALPPVYQLASGEGTKETREVAKGGLTGCPRTGILAKQPIDLAQLILS